MRLLPLTVMLVLPLHAGAIVDASSATSALLRTGDSLAFQVLSANFSFNAARFGLDPYPTDVSFIFVTAPLAGPATVSAWLESPDGQASDAFHGPLAFTPGLFAGTQYRGSTSTVQSYLHLAPELSASIFGTGSARLILRNDGDDLRLGLPPYTLRQDLSVSLTGGPLSVGALSGTVNVQSEVPEPVLMLPGLFSLVLMRFAGRSQNQPFANR
jgi:hypothetical protein